MTAAPAPAPDTTAAAATGPLSGAATAVAAQRWSRRAGRARRATVAVLIWVASLTAAGAACEAAARLAPSGFVPPPSMVAAWIRATWLTGPPHHLYLNEDLLHHLGASVGRMLTGWTAAVILGISLGILLGRSPVARDFVNPLVQFGRSVPPVVLIPVYYLLFPDATIRHVVLIVTGAIWPVLLNTITGVRGIDPALLDTVRVLKVGPVRRLGGVLLPAAAPTILTGLRISLAIALLLTVVSEMFGATEGLGYALLDAQQHFDTTAMWAWIVPIAVLGNLGHAALNGLSRAGLARHGHPDPHQLER